jgi:hypothetical protein
MSDFTNHTQDAVREFCIRADVALRNAARRVREESRGQTAAEYMGVLLVIAVIIGVLVTSSIGQEIVNGAITNIKKVAAGDGK